MTSQRTLSILLAASIYRCCAAQPALVDPQIAAEIAKIRAIDDHAHPVRAVLSGPPDIGYDALPVENLEGSSEPVRTRGTNPEIAAAHFALYGKNSKKEVIAREGDGYPAWVLDRCGIGTMLANRVTLGPSTERPRFEWVPYADALLFPFDTRRFAVISDRKAFFELESKLLGKYLTGSGQKARPASLGEYLHQVISGTLERQKAGGALAVKFEAAYLRSLQFDAVSAAEAERIYADGSPSPAEYERLGNYLFRYIAGECGRLGMAVHLHVAAGGGGYFAIAGAIPLLLESVVNDPGLRQTNFVLVHGGWPFTREMTALLTKPNVYTDISQQTLMRYPRALAATIREWLEFVPEKVMFGTDAYPYSEALGWEESCWMASRTARQALGMALTGMLADGEITRARARELARMVLRENARKLYGLPSVPAVSRPAKRP